jgi:hypothetical protein
MCAPVPEAMSGRAGFGAQFFQEVAAVVNVDGAPDRARLAAVMSRYGLVPVAPRI